MLTTQRQNLGEHPNEGARLLWEAMTARGWSQYRLAKELRVKNGVVGRWLYCDQRPDSERRARIEDLLGISWRAWDLEPTEPIVLPVAA